LDVEPAKQHDGLLSIDSSVAWIPFLQTFVGMHGQDTSVAPKSVVATAKVDTADSVLSQGRGAHDARLNCDVKIGLLEFGGGELGQEFGDGEEFGMSSPIERSICVVHAPSNDFSVEDEDAGNRRLTPSESLFGDIDGLPHETLVDFQILEDFWIEFVFVAWLFRIRHVVV